jgi:hypothetical protein
MSTRQDALLRHLFIAGVALPTVIAVLVEALLRGRIRAGPLLIPIAIANAVPFWLLCALGLSDFTDVAQGRLLSRDVTIRITGAWVAMCSGATAIMFATLHAGQTRARGASTDPVAVLMSPIYIFVVGLGAYAGLWALTAVYRALNRRIAAKRAASQASS